ncbi:LEA type 2 family protein [Pseudoxanthomonas dokdonensis]|uniref:Late embryogenesis abundant protein LEA-2 subgroup domain-containing protein n=1 Tax=Pseudoxanthomonas dokdonensis TaxID=344882 RepID=A0A0R0CT22_9GAMM|nr:LEA type 2 family protein [Pseudoxanthomonas dokdonensis]KRG69239.1 hypothetical protein ABB29_11835 [Pseudoxanthomonas dokdonensis]
MKRATGIVGLVLLMALLASCSSGPARRVSEPAVFIQQLSVDANGSWKVDLRLQNYSSIPMRFDQLRLELQLSGQAAGTLQASPQLSVGPESADVVSVALQPTSAGRIAVADALASRRAIEYQLSGTANALPEDGKSRDFDISSNNLLNPVPGLDGVLR